MKLLFAALDRPWPGRVVGAGALAAAVVLSGCRGMEQPAPRTPSEAPETSSEWASPREKVDVQTSLRPAASVRWPEGWRQLESGAFGPTEDPVSWYRVEALGDDVRSAMTQAMDAFRPRTGETASEHVSVDPQGEHGVGQLRGERAFVSFDATVRGETTIIRVTSIRSNL